MMKKLSKLGRANLILLLILTLMTVSAVVSAQAARVSVPQCTLQSCDSDSDCPDVPAGPCVCMIILGEPMCADTL